MADVQDDDQWLYGDEKEGERQEPTQESGEIPPQEKSSEAPQEVPSQPNGDADLDKENESGGEKDGDDSSSDEDGPTVTIGKLVRQPDILRPPPPTLRAAPQVTGVKDDDFNTPGKINQVPVIDFNIADHEEKPWRTPGADITDYFNYGFQEHTWIRYCERQKSMRTNESGTGMHSLGLRNDMDFGQARYNRRYNQPANWKGSTERNGREDEGNAYRPEGRTIQVMTAERRIYSSNKNYSVPPPMQDSNYRNGPGEFDSQYYQNVAPPPHIVGGGGQPNPPPDPYGVNYNQVQGNANQGNSWSLPPPSLPPQQDHNRVQPLQSTPINPHHTPEGLHKTQTVPTLSQVPMVEGDMSGVRVKEEPEWSRSPERTKSRRSRSGSRNGRSGSWSNRRRSYSRSRSKSPNRHRRRRSRREYD